MNREQPGRNGPGPDAPRRIGPYVLERRIGRGGMGEVFRAWDERLERPVALKRLHGARDDARRELLLQEARALAAVDHPAVVRVHDVWDGSGSWPPRDEQDDRDSTRDDGVWLVMEWLDGLPLSRHLAAGPMGWGEAADLGAALADGLGALHRRGILHRDLKAENVLVVGGRYKIVDLGLARKMDVSGRTPSERGAVGTPRAMAPEQALGRPLDARADLFSLGALLYRALTGVPPYAPSATPSDDARTASGDPAEETLRSLFEAPLVPVTELRPDVPDELAGWIHRLLAKDPAQRPAEAADLRTPLRELALQADELGGLDTPTLAPDSDPSAPSTEARSTSSSSPTPWYRHPTGPLAVAALTGVLLAVLLAWTKSLPFRTTPAAGPGGAAESSSEASEAVETAPAETHVAVLPPRWITEPAQTGDDSALLSTALRTAAVERLASTPLLRALSARDVDPLLAAEDGEDGAPSVRRLAHALGADEVLDLQLECGETLCRVQLERLRADGTVSGSVTFDVTLDRPQEAARALQARLADLYRDLHRDLYRNLDAEPQDGPSSEVPPAAYRRLLEIRGQIDVLPAAETDAVLAELSELRAAAPRFLDVYLQEIKLLRRRYQSSRDPAELERALALAETAKVVFPDHVEPLLKEAELWLTARRLDEARGALDRLSARDPGDPDVLYLEARWAELTGDADAALEFMSRHAQRPNWRRLQNLAGLQARLGRHEEARATLGQMLERAPASYSGRSLLAQLELLHGDPVRAAELYEELVATSDAYGARMNLGLAQMLLGRWEAALASFRRAVELRPDDPATRLNLADALWLLGRESEARESYRRVVELAAGRDDVSARRDRAQALAHLGRHAEAVGQLEEALRQSPDDPQTAYAASLVFTLVGDLTSAEVQARRALDGGLERRWFGLPFFGPLAERLDLQAGPSTPDPTTGAQGSVP